MYLRKVRTIGWHDLFLHAYLIIVILAGFIGGVAFCFATKPDSSAVAFLAFIDGLIGAVYKFITAKENKTRLLQYSSSSTSDRGNNASTQKRDIAETIIRREAESIRTPNPDYKCRKLGRKFSRQVNRVLMVIHSLLVLISVAGAIELAIAYSYKNP